MCEGCNGATLIGRERLTARRVFALIVATTMLDAEEISKSDLGQLYRARWNAELDLRSLKRTMQKLVQDELAMRLLSGEFGEGDTVEVDVQADKLAFERAREPVPAAKITTVRSIGGRLPKRLRGSIGARMDIRRALILASDDRVATEIHVGTPLIAGLMVAMRGVVCILGQAPFAGVSLIFHAFVHGKSGYSHARHAEMVGTVIVAFFRTRVRHDGKAEIAGRGLYQRI